VTRAAKALLRAERGYWEAVAVRDPAAIAVSEREHASAYERVERQRKAEATR
jgi:hypothetical protein